MRQCLIDNKNVELQELNLSSNQRSESVASFDCTTEPETKEFDQVQNS